jgi:hypothetical protein
MTARVVSRTVAQAGSASPGIEVAERRERIVGRAVDADWHGQRWIVAHITLCRDEVRAQRRYSQLDNVRNGQARVGAINFEHPLHEFGRAELAERRSAWTGVGRARRRHEQSQRGTTKRLQLSRRLIRDQRAKAVTEEGNAVRNACGSEPVHYGIRHGLDCRLCRLTQTVFTTRKLDGPDIQGRGHCPFAIGRSRATGMGETEKTNVGKTLVGPRQLPKNSCVLAHQPRTVPVCRRETTPSRDQRGFDAPERRAGLRRHASMDTGGAHPRDAAGRRGRRVSHPDDPPASRR